MADYVLLGVPSVKINLKCTALRYGPEMQKLSDTKIAGFFLQWSSFLNASMHNSVTCS